MAKEEYKALTHINLPFLEKRFAPGEMISYGDFESYAVAASNNVPQTDDPNASPLHTADSMIEEFLEWGTISDDPEAEIHPQNRIPTPGELTEQSVVAAAQALAERLEADGKPIPPTVQALLEAHADRTFVDDRDAGQGDDRHV